MENQNASAEYPHIPASSSLQSALLTASPACAVLAVMVQPGKCPVWMGGVLFFKLQRFFCGKAAGFSPPPLNAGRSILIRALSIAARCPALCGSLDTFAQRSSYTLIQL